jgi:hypothetical protein
LACFDDPWQRGREVFASVPDAVHRAPSDEQVGPDPAHLVGAVGAEARAVG